MHQSMGRSKISRIVVAVVAVTCAAALPGAFASADNTPPREQVVAKLRRLGISVEFTDRLFRIPASSMEPTIHCQRPLPYCEAATADRIVVRPYPAERRPARGEIVAFDTPQKNGVDLAGVACGAGGIFVKRMIGLPGDRVHEDVRGFVYVNGKKLDEPYVQSLRRKRDVENRNRTWTVPQGRYFLVGDNRWQSCDSRRFGSVPGASIIGRAIAIYWPPARVRRL